MDIDINKIIETFETLKRYVYIIERGNKKSIAIKFTNDNFYHLLGLHKMDLDQFFPTHIKSKSKRYKYIKKNPDKFNNIIKNQFKRKESLELRVKTFPKILDMLDGNDVSLYNLKVKTVNDGYMKYDGDFVLTKTYEFDIYCLLGLIIDDSYDNVINCIPNSWMANNRMNNLVKFRKANYINKINAIPIELYNDINLVTI